LEQLVFVRRIAVIGTGYVGLTTGACLASLGHHVTCADVDADKIKRLDCGEVDILEPGLAELVTGGLAAGRLSFVVGAAAAVADAEVVFLCVPTPMGVGGVADLSVVESVIEEIRDLIGPGTVLVNKSTVPVGTAVRTAELLGRRDVAVVSNPEFLREGSAVSDFLKPDRIVVGGDKQDAAERVAALYARLGAPAVLTDARSGSLSRVRLGLLGLTFKAGTDDLRDSPALAVAALLRQAGARLVGYDPALGDGADLDGVTLVADPYQAAADAEALVVLTEWPEFRTLDWPRMADLAHRPVVVDTRNLLDPDVVRRAGLTWYGIGRR
jgi:UDP-glucose 6-dehydrogenase